jgi:hypothetical protein
MREIRPSGLKGETQLNASSLPLSDLFENARDQAIKEGTAISPNARLATPYHSRYCPPNVLSRIAFSA